MTRNAVFVDTAALVAVTNTRDAWHHRAVQVLVALTKDKKRLVTSQWVLSEFLAQVGATNARESGCELIRRWRASPNVDIRSADSAGGVAAFDLYALRSDKQWSHVDCTSMLICQELDLEEVFTTDHHFAQAGFNVLLTG